METAVEKLRWERRRKLQVREAFARGLDRWRNSPGDPVPFYLACADYLIPAQRRLIDQDRRLARLLAPQVPAAQAEDHQAIAALRERLELADGSLSGFSAAAEALRREGPAGRVRFEAAAAQFLDVLVNTLGARSHSLRHLTSTLLSETDWITIADITPAMLEDEARRFSAVQAAAPAGIDPADMPVEPRRS
jgi:hypothetical protein